MPNSVLTSLGLSALLLASACSLRDSDNADENASLQLRNLTNGSAAAPLKKNYPIQGNLIPTPSDTRTRYYLLRHRAPIMGDTLIALLREESAGNAAYARVEIDCARRLFHIVGVGNRRSFAETSTVRDGPLRPIDGLPLRQEIASYICEQHGTPLADAS